jgi:hypothetical protein
VAQSYYYSNVAVAGLLGATINNSVTSMYMSTTPTGYPGSFPFKVVLDQGTASEEIVKVTAGNGTVGTPWTIVRAWDGTTAQPHTGLTATIGHYITAEDETLSRLHEALITSGSGAHGLPASAWATAAIAALDETTLANSTTAAVTWSSISAAYNHLLIIVQGKFTENANQSDHLTVTINGDTTASYSLVDQSASNGSGSSTGALVGSQSTGAGSPGWGCLSMAGSLAGNAASGGGGFLIIPNYTSTTFNKCFYGMSGAGYGTGAFVSQSIRSGYYNPSVQAAITSLTLTAPQSKFYQTGTFLGLYGLS